MRKFLLLVILCRFLMNDAEGQSTIGLPAIRNYTNIDYHAAIEIWGIGQDKHNILYFANNDGLLTFDGAYWKLFPLPNKAAIRSLAIDDSGKIFVGGQDEIGYFYPGGTGMLVYHSLKERLPPVARQFADIWSIVILGNAVFFRTIESIFELKDDSLQTFDAPGGWLFLAKAGSTLYAEDRVKGLQVFHNGQWEASGVNPIHITGIMEYAQDTLLVATLKSGLYLLHGSALSKEPTAIDHLLASDLVNTAFKIEDDRYVLGTNDGGAYMIDHAGRLIQQYANNGILAIFPDRDKNLWLGLKNGMACIHYNTAVKHIYPVKDRQIMCNAVSVFDKKLFIGTSNGLYSVPLDPAQDDISSGKGVFTEVAGSKGQVWSLAEVNHELLCGHEDGAFVIRHDRAIPLLTGQGAWGFAFIPSSNDTDIIAGTYTGLQRIHYEKGEFREEGRASPLYESLSSLAMDGHHTVWASHPYRGVFKIEADVPYTHYTPKDGLPSDLNNFVFWIRNKIVIATEKGVYEYDSLKGKFMPSPFFKPLIGDNSVEYLAEDHHGHIWFISNQRVGVIDFNKSSVIYFPELDGQTVKGAGYIYPYDDENIFIGGNNGLFHLNYNQYIKTDTGVSVLLSTVEPVGKNSINFEYASPVYARENNVEFSYRLEGFDKAWSDWSPKTEKDYTNLSFGDYTFYVRARNNLGNASAPVQYRFSIAPAWYQTPWAWLLYIALAAFVVWGVRKRQRSRLALHQKRHEEEQERLNYLHGLELIALQKAKLETELATVTMHLVERGRLLLTIKEELLSVIKRLNISSLAHEFKSVFRLMSDTEKSDDDWNRFAIHFDQVHNNFLSTLKAKFPSLSATDLKLCAYLRLNLSSKEIAQMLNISLKGVEVSRYRIRKKFNLATETNLYDFLIDVTGRSSP
ncbi:ligand-binding sensor domain-containing protein [Dinghuibacter silviterrae]|uniref:Regulatory LuxR family protein n=1 Tax=Dinghuibacter silviterrae TaxID=1539049 RepID=A0A4R8DI90_9BACT|nr:triple tyrosine motif-containing protein [Dinghuibacter silviterrae]TDW97451.1 regulatory LuxR family protein [Dinghuibacter silviterrae]